MPAPSSLTVLLDRLYITIASPIILFKILFDFLTYGVPAMRPSKTWNIEQAIRMRIVRYLVYSWAVWRAGDKLHLRPGKERNRWAVLQPADAKLYKGPLVDDKVAPKPLGATWTPSHPPGPSLVGKNLTVALHFHGGAFCIGNGRDEDTGYLARTLIKHVGVSHVLTPQYRLSSSPGGHFPANIQDALTCYVYLLRECGIPASQIIFSGDSAGGNMCLGLLRYLDEFGETLNIPAPAAVALWSPWVDVSAAEVQDLRESPNYGTDYLSREFGMWGSNTITDYGRLDVTAPYISPLLHPFQVRGRTMPVFVNACEREVLHDYIVDFAGKYKEHGGWNVSLCVSPDSPHDILLLGPRAGFHKQAEDACEQARAFFRRETDLELWPVPISVLC